MKKDYLEMASDLLHDLNEGMNKGEINFSAEFQLLTLGLNEKKLEKLKGQFVLDSCCGREAKLVEYLRNEGIVAEGMDPQLQRSEDYLFRRRVGVAYNGKGTIPREDEHYKLILMHGFREVYFPFSGVKSWERAGNAVDASVILMELSRVLKKGGEIISYPSILNLEPSHMSLGGLGFRVVKEEIKEFQRSTIMDEMFEPLYGSDSRNVIEAWKRRTIITKL